MHDPSMKGFAMDDDCKQASTYGVIITTMIISSIAMIAGNARAAVPPDQSIDYRYDALGRLASITYSGGNNNGLVQSISLDLAGNRSVVTTSGSTNAGQTNAAQLAAPQTPILPEIPTLSEK